VAFRPLKTSAHGDTLWRGPYCIELSQTSATQKETEILEYVHRNPVARGMVAKSGDWKWSNFRHYAAGCAGTMEIESFWTASRRDRRGHLPAEELLR
jgi:hypothetical protein